MSEPNLLGSERTREILKCKLCTQYLRDPRQLPCGHSFCLQCLELYYRSECQRSESGRRRSPSVERRRRGLLSCPAAPVCLHVSIVPDEGVAAFPVNRKIADIKEHVVNEMAQNISRRIGRPHSAWVESDATSVRSDETDFTDISCETTSSAPAGSFDHPDGKSRYPNLAKYAKYFEMEKDEGSGESTKYRSNIRSERRRVAMSSSFQHRRRRMHTPTPASYDDSTTSGLGSHHPSRCESAPHLDSDEINYRPTVKPRQGSTKASPLLRKNRPTSCILEELSGDAASVNDASETTGLDETPRRATSTDRHPQPLLRDRVVLPTHNENISMDQNRRSMPARDVSAKHARHHAEDVKSSHATGKAVPGKDGLPTNSKLHSEKLESAKNCDNTMPAKDVSSGDSKRHSENTETYNNSTKLPAQRESASHQKHHYHHLETGATSTNHIHVGSEPDNRGKWYSHHVETGSSSSRAAKEASTSQSHSDDVKSGKTSTTAATSRPGRRLLPNIPVNCNTAETLSGVAGRAETTTSDVRQARQLPRVDKVVSKERHYASSSSSHGPKEPDLSNSSRAVTSEPDKPKSSTAGLSDTSKSQSSTKVTRTDQQRTPDCRSSSKTVLSETASAKSSLSNLAKTKPSASAAKLRDVHQHPKSSDTGRKSSSSNSSTSQKSQSSGKLSADTSRSQSNSAAAGSRVNSDTERTESSQHPGQTTPDVRGSRDEQCRDSGGQKERQSSGSKSRPSKSTPGSGSRLTYKVNAATVQPVLMNSKKTKVNSAKTGSRSSVETAATDVDEKHKDSEETTPASETDETQKQKNDVKRPTATTDAKVSAQNSFNENSHHGGSPGMNNDCDQAHPRNAGASAPRCPKPDDEPGTNECHTDDCLPPTDDKAADADAAANDDAKKKQQWHAFMATLQAARTKYSSTDNRLPASIGSRPRPVYSDVITPCWRIQRDDFAVPTSIAIAADGSAVIADVAHCLLDFTDADGNVVYSATGTKPFSVVVGANANVYVSDRRSRTVGVFDLHGSDVAQWDAETTSFGWISGMAALRNGQLAIVDRERCKVGIYTAGGERVTEFASYGTKDAQLCMADFVAVDSHNRVIVSDSGNHRLKLFDPSSGKLVASFAGRGNADGCLLWPKGVTVDSADRIIVADSGNDRICVFAEDGSFISNWASAIARPFHVSCGGDSLLGVTHFALSGASQVDVFTISSSL